LNMYHNVITYSLRKQAHNLAGTQATESESHDTDGSTASFFMQPYWRTAAVVFDIYMEESRFVLQ
jgi:hypothetical protein